MALYEEEYDFPDLSKIRDRGSKKWVAMMLPEHVKMIREYNEEIKKVARPQLDEWDLEIIQQSIEIAMKRKSDSKVKLWKDGQFIYKRGTIEDVDLKRRIIELQDPFYLHQINLDAIVDVTILD